MIAFEYIAQERQIIIYIRQLDNSLWGSKQTLSKQRQSIQHMGTLAYVYILFSPDMIFMLPLSSILPNMMITESLEEQNNCVKLIHATICNNLKTFHRHS
jgi:hypothetical protein